MYLRYFGLNEAPFSITPDPAFVYLSPRHRDAFAHLLYGIGKGGSGGFVQLTGEVGTGKTTLCRCLLEQIPDGTRIALLLNPLVTPRELLAAVSEKLGIDIDGSIDSTRLLVDGLNRYLLDAHERGERVVVVIDEAQNLSPEALEQVRLLTNLETSKEKLLQIVLLGQPELRELLQRRNLRQLAQRITARYHLSPLGPKDTHLYIAHRMQIAGAQRNPFRRTAMNALYQRSQGIPRLINIIADRSLVAAFAKERMDVTAAMVHEAANEVQLGENQVKRVRWPWFAAAAVALIMIAVAVTTLKDIPAPVIPMQAKTDLVASQVTTESQSAATENTDAVATEIPALPEPEPAETVAVLDTGWLAGLGLPVVLVLQGQTPAFLLLHGIDGDRLLVGEKDQLQTVSKDSVESMWLGSYLVIWPQAPEWPVVVKRGDDGPAVSTIMEMATRVDVPYHGEQVFEEDFERWLQSYQLRNGLQADGIVGRKTLLYLMTASIQDPRILQSW
jgi:general secretion pathway protein A